MKKKWGKREKHDEREQRKEGKKEGWEARTENIGRKERKKERMGWGGGARNGKVKNNGGKREEHDEN